MAITNSFRVTFRFENINGVFYDVTIDYATGVGVARKHGLTINTAPMHNAPETVLTVDPAELAAWQSANNAQRKHAAIYNGGQTLAAILNAAS